MTEQQNDEPSSALTLYHLSQILPLLIVVFVDLWLSQDWSTSSDFFLLSYFVAELVSQISARPKCKANNSPVYNLVYNFSFTSAVKRQLKRLQYHKLFDQ